MEEHHRSLPKVTDTDYRMTEFDESPTTDILIGFKPSWEDWTFPYIARITESPDEERYVIHIAKVYRGYCRTTKSDAISRAKMMLAQDRGYDYHGET